MTSWREKFELANYKYSHSWFLRHEKPILPGPKRFLINAAAHVHNHLPFWPKIDIHERRWWEKICNCDDFRFIELHYKHKGRRLGRRNSLCVAQAIQAGADLQHRVVDQSSSVLLSKVPIEIRNIIYDFALTTTTATFVILGHWHPNGKGMMVLNYQQMPLTSRSCVPLNEDAFGGPVVPCLTALLCTCRKVYTEALPILYSRAQFVFRARKELKLFSYITPASHFQFIRSVRQCHKYSPDTMVEFQEHALSILQTLPNILTFYVVWEVHGGSLRKMAEHYWDSKKQLRAAASTRCTVIFWVREVRERTIVPDHNVHWVFQGSREHD